MSKNHKKGHPVQQPETDKEAKELTKPTDKEDRGSGR